MAHRRWATTWIGRAVLVAMVLGTVLVALPAAPVAASVKTVSVTPAGMYAHFVVQTDHPAKFILSASTAAPTYSGFTPSFAKVDSAILGQLGQGPCCWVANLHNLKPDTTYHYILKTTMIGQERGIPYSYKTGTFKTKQRVVTVKFNTVEIIDDSDDLSQGDFWFYYKVNGDWYGRDEHDISSGDSAQLNRTIVINEAPSVLAFRVQAVDKDCDFINFCDFDVIPPFNTEAGETEDFDWATASTGNLPMDFDDSDPNHKKPRSFTVSTTAHKVKFKAHGTYTVTYK